MESASLHMLAVVYTALHQIHPTMDTAVDFAAESKATMEILKAQPMT